MQNLLIQFEKIQNKSGEIRKTCKINQLPISLLNGFNCKKMKDIHLRLMKHYKQHPDKGKTLWFESQLKLYNWVILIQSLLLNKKIEQFNDQIWLKIKEIFPEKQLYTFKYQAKKILSLETKNSRIWNFEEDSILRSVMKDPEMANRWNQVARRFYLLADQKYFRTGKQCREHWINHLDSSKKHGKWEKQQDQIILNFVLQQGKKWSTISKDFLSHRTEHMIKNRYKSLVTKFRKNCIFEEGENSSIKRILKIISKKNQQNFQERKIYEQQEEHKHDFDDKKAQKQKNNFVKTQEAIQKQQMLPQMQLQQKSNSFISIEQQEQKQQKSQVAITPLTNASPIGFLYTPVNNVHNFPQYWSQFNIQFLAQNQYQSYQFLPLNFFC